MHARQLMRDNAYMADVSIYVAVISASAAILGAAVSPVSTAYQAHRQARRDRQERRETSAHRAFLQLLRAAADLRTQAANNHEYHGEEMAARLARVREHAADVGVHAISIALLAPPLADPAGRLAEAAGRLAATAAENTDLAMGVSIRAPDFGELDACVAAFSKAAVDYAEG
jgi:hypothetical protein